MNQVEIKIMSGEDLCEMAELAEKSFPAEYNITEVNLDRKLIKDSDRFAEGSLVLRRTSDRKLAGFIGTKLSHCDLYPDTAWISIVAVDKEYRGKGYGKMLCNRVFEELSERRIKTVIIGQEFNNFFSGIPETENDSTGFFKSLGFTVNEGKHYDLEAFITDNEALKRFDSSPFTKEFEARVYNNEYEKLTDFLNREFPGRWAYEAKQAIKAGKESCEVVLLWNKQEEIVGFCMLSSYRDACGKKTGYGGLGPIGIAENVRGRRVGNYLLYEALRQSVKNGIERVNIDWTVLLKFYGQFGFEIKRTYKAACKNLNT